jgi:hypothetical protein
MEQNQHAVALSRGEDYGTSLLNSCVFVFNSFYQIRTALRVSPKLPVKVEVNLPRNQREYSLLIIIKSAFSIIYFGIRIEIICRYETRQS